MPIVFGGAVTVNALISAYRFRGHANISPLLWIGMLIVAVGIVIVARNAPHHAPKPPSAAGESHAAAPGTITKSRVHTDDSHATHGM
jgi:hypothetical protein